MATPLGAQVTIDLAPPKVEALVEGGSEFQDGIRYRNRGAEAMDVRVEVVDFDVTDDGTVVEQPPGTGSASLVPYLRVTPSTVRVEAGGETIFRYAVKSPDDLVHLRAMVFFVSRPVDVAGAATQVVIVPRLGVPIYVESRDAAPADLELDGFGVRRDGDLLEVTLSATNQGERLIRPTGELRVLPDSGPAVSFEFNGGAEPVLPGMTRTWVSRHGPVPGGALSVQLVVQRSFGDRERLEQRVSAQQSSSS